MRTYARKASVQWLGSRQHGRGTLRTPSAALPVALFATDQHPKKRGTNPCELIAAAHAGSFILALANELGEAGYSPRQIDASSTVTMENLGGTGWTMTQIHLEVIATVPRIAECEFVDAALRAKVSCPVSRALRANISMSARLAAVAPPPARARKPRSSRPAEPAKPPAAGYTLSHL